MSAPADLVTIVGAGMAGAACAVALRAAGVPVRILERGRAPGGRMASPEIHGRRVDLGAGYLTVSDAGFRAVVEQWEQGGLIRPWTDTFGVIAADCSATTKSGPQRWATPGGLRSLVRDLLTDIDVQRGETVSQVPAGRVVLAMPDPQAARLIPVVDEVGYRPTLTLVCGFAARTWSFADAAFVNGHPDLEFVADDGARRGDGAAVLVVHSTADRARQHLDDPDGAIEPMVAALSELLETPKPAWSVAHRWTFAQPEASHHEPFGSAGAGDGRLVGLAGDQWCPTGSPRVESAWLSGTHLGQAIAEGRL